MGSGPQEADLLRHPRRLGGPQHFTEVDKIRGPKWQNWLRHPCRLRGPKHLKAMGNIGMGPQVGAFN